jgi:hypothetical protein
MRSVANTQIHVDSVSPYFADLIIPEVRDTAAVVSEE